MLFFIKKPWTRDLDSVLDNENVLGQLFDYMKRLESFYGLQHIFGIIIDYVYWRICWLDTLESCNYAFSGTLPEIPPTNKLSNLCDTKPLDCLTKMINKRKLNFCAPLQLIFVEIYV